MAESSQFNETSSDPSALLEGADPDRVYFSPGNPWTQGHAVDYCAFEGKLFEDNTLVVNLHLSTVDYRANDGGEFLDEGDESDWGAKVVWNNYHAFRVGGTVLVGTESDPISLLSIADKQFVADPLPESYQRFLDDELNFEANVLGHDSVADHRIEFGAYRAGKFPISWAARIALSYSGSEEFDRYFAVKTSVSELDEIYVIGDRPDEEVLQGLAKVLTEHEIFEIQHRNELRYLVKGGT